MNNRGQFLAFFLFLTALGLAACAGLFGGTPSEPQITTEQVLKHAFAVAETVGDAVIRVKGYAVLQKSAPEAIPLIDLNNDHVITLAEVRAAGEFLLAKPELVAGLLAAAYLLRKGGG
jgi:hypothetical protein